MGAGSTMTGSKLGGREVMSHLPANQMPSCHGTARILQHQQAATHLTFPQEMIISGNTGAGKQSNTFREVENIKVTTYTENLHKKSLLSNSLSFPSSGKTEECEPSNCQTSHQPQQT